MQVHLWSGLSGSVANVVMVMRVTNWEMGLREDKRVRVEEMGRCNFT